jgi:hypothetical protein
MYHPKVGGSGKQHSRPLSTELFLNACGSCDIQ